MAQPISYRMRKAWNAFRGVSDEEYTYRDLGYYSSVGPSTPRFSGGNEKTILTAIYNRIALDVASYDLAHVRVDDQNRYLETLNTGLNNCLTIEANKDQTHRSFLQDVILSMFDEGSVAIIPTDTTISPISTGGFDILSLRTGKVMAWYPNHVRIEAYNDNKGIREEITLPKAIVGIIENPHYAVMNEPNGTLRRLIRKLILLDAVDEQSGSGKLDLIIQLPYVIKTEARQKQAEERRLAIERQLSGSKYGIAYTDGTERITQLNRPSENNLLEQITYLTNLLYSQLGISADVFDGTASESKMMNYYNRTIEPLVTSVTDEMRRKFLTKTARTQGQRIMGFKDVLRLIPANEIADMADGFTRNEILTSNEVRSVLGLKPSTAPQADELRNKNMPQQDQPNYQANPQLEAPTEDIAEEDGEDLDENSK